MKIFKNISAQGGSASGGKRHFKIFNIKYSIFLFFVLCSLLFFVVPAFADDKKQEPSPTFKNAFGQVNETAKGAYGEVPSGSLEETVAKWITAALSLVGVIFLILMVYGGYIWMIARGDEAEAKKAKGIIEMAIIGMIIVIAAYAATRFVVDRLVAGAGG